jgi:hypothetical protein
MAKRMVKSDSDRTDLPDAKFVEYKRHLVAQLEDNKNELKELRDAVHQQDIQIAVLKTKVLMAGVAASAVTSLVVGLVVALLSKA